MAELQYIGARYVPKFFDGASGSEWLANTQYEALTIVTRNGNSYTSKIPVPASVGAPENNPNYWVSTGIYSQQVETYRQLVEDYAQSVEELANDIEGNERHIVVISDSFGTNNGGGTLLQQDLGEALAAYLRWDSSYIHFSGRNSAGFYNDYFIESLNSVLNNMDNDTKNKVKDVYVVGGWNDHNDSEANVRAKASTFKSRVNSQLPNANLHTIYLAYGYITQISVLNTLIATRKIYDSLDGYISHPDAWFTLHDRELFLENSDHPNDGGMKAIADTVGHIVLGFNKNIERQHNITTGLTVRNGSMDSPSYVFRETMSNGITTLNFYAVRMFVTLTEAETLNLHSGGFVIGTIDGLYCRGQQNNYCTNIVIPFYDSDYNRVNVSGALAIDDGTIRFIPNDAKNTSGGNESISIKYYTIPMFNLTMFSR